MQICVISLKICVIILKVFTNLILKIIYTFNQFLKLIIIIIYNIIK